MYNMIFRISHAKDRGILSFDIARCHPLAGVMEAYYSMRFYSQVFLPIVYDIDLWIFHHLRMGF